MVLKVMPNFGTFFRVYICGATSPQLGSLLPNREVLPKRWKASYKEHFVICTQVSKTLQSFAHGSSRVRSFAYGSFICDAVSSCQVWVHANYYCSITVTNWFVFLISRYLNNNRLKAIPPGVFTELPVLVTMYVKILSVWSTLQILNFY